MARITVVQDTVADKLEEFIRDKKVQGLCDKSVSTYKCHLSVILPLDTPWESVDWSEVVLSINSRDLAPYTKVTYLRSLKCFQRHYGIPITYKIPSIETVKEIYTDDEIKLLTKKPTKCTFPELRTWAMILLALDTGLRSASLRGIKIGDIQPFSVVIRHTKTRKVQLLPYGETTENAIKKYLKSRGGSPDDYLFCDVYGNQLSETAMKNALVRYCKARGVEHHSWHMFRHTFAKKFLLDCGESPFMLQQMLGHSSLEMSRHYCNLFNADLMHNYASPVENMHKSYAIKNK